jgi:hypothetical protein
MKTERLAAHHEAREASVLSVVERDGHYADRVFAFADLVLSLLKQQSRRRSSTNGFAFVPHTCRVLGQHSSGCRTSAVK